MWISNGWGAIQGVAKGSKQSSDKGESRGAPEKGYRWRVSKQGLAGCADRLSSCHAQKSVCVAPAELMQRPTKGEADPVYTDQPLRLKLESGCGETGRQKETLEPLEGEKEIGRRMQFTVVLAEAFAQKARCQHPVVIPSIDPLVSKQLSNQELAEFTLLRASSLMKEENCIEAVAMIERFCSQLSDSTDLSCQTRAELTLVLSSCQKRLAELKIREQGYLEAVETIRAFAERWLKAQKVRSQTLAELVLVQMEAQKSLGERLSGISTPIQLGEVGDETVAELALVKMESDLSGRPAITDFYPLLNKLSQLKSIARQTRGEIVLMKARLCEKRAEEQELFALIEAFDGEGIRNETKAQIQISVMKAQMRLGRYREVLRGWRALFQETGEFAYICNETRAQLALLNMQVRYELLRRDPLYATEENCRTIFELFAQIRNQTEAFQGVSEQTQAEFACVRGRTQMRILSGKGEGFFWKIVDGAR